MSHLRMLQECFLISVCAAPRALVALRVDYKDIGSLDKGGGIEGEWEAGDEKDREKFIPRLFVLLNPCSSLRLYIFNVHEA
jgi:hypothetical protein